MQNSDKDLLFMSLKDKLPQDDLMLFKEKLQQASDAQCESLLFLNLKNPVITLFLSLCFGMFGADRFYKGDVKLGIAKLCVFFSTFFLLFLAGFFALDDETSAVASSIVLVFLLFLTIFIWAFADIFLCFFGTKKDNLKKVLEVL